MKWIKAILTFFTIVLIPMILMNLLLGYGTQPFIEHLMFQLYGIIFAVPFIATCLIFASELERTRKVKWMWITLGIYFVLLITLLFIGAMFAKGGDGGTLGVVIFGIAYLVGMAIVNVPLSYLTKFDEKKQLRIILVLFVITLIIDLLQLFGLFRPALLE